MRFKEILKWILNLLIILNIFLILSIIFYGGYEIEIWRILIKCHNIKNPFIGLIILLIGRICISIGNINSILLISSITVALLFFEIFLRITNNPLSFPNLKKIIEPYPLLGYRLIAGIKDGNISINSHHLRDRERSWIKPEGIKRILGIGDSFTFGYKVSNEQCFLKILEKLLNTESYVWDVINAGVPGYNMWQYVRYLENFGYRYMPDLIIVSIYLDDFYGSPGFKVLSIKKSNNYKFYKKIRVINFLNNFYEKLIYRYRFLFGAKWLKDVESRRSYFLANRYGRLLKGTENRNIYSRFEYELGRIKALIDLIGSNLLVIYIPDVVQLNFPALKVLNRKIDLMCKNREIDFIDMTSYLENSGNINELYLLPYDAHLSYRGHYVVARVLYNYIKKMGY